MNAILTRTKQDHLNGLWEPFATSTPVKIVPNNAKIENLLHKQLLVDSHNFMGKRLSVSNIIQSNLTESKHRGNKKVRKNRTSSYFDLSSSSSSDDDSDENKKRPIIKLSSKKNGRSLLNSKKTESERTEVVNAGVGERQKVNNPKRVKNVGKNKDVGDLRNKKNDKTKAKCVSSDEECKIFDESNRNSMISVKAGGQNAENAVSDENVKKSEQPSDVGKTVKTKMPKVAIKTCKSEIKSQKTYNNNKGTKVLKRKATNITDNAEPVKKCSSRSSRSPRESVKLEKAVTPLHIWAHKSNLSHQLFSDSREQEFINTLDLTSEDINEAIENEKHAIWRKTKSTPKKQIPATTKDESKLEEPKQERPVRQKQNTKETPRKQIPATTKDESKLEESKQDRPVRQKQKPKEYWMPEGTSPSNENKPARSKQNQKISKTSKPKSEKQKQLEDGEVKENNENNKVLGNNGKSPKGGKKVRRKRGNVLKEQRQNGSADGVVAGGCENKLKEGDTKFSGGDAEMNGPVVEEKAVTGVETVFKRLGELSFKDNEMGCSVVQCHNIHNFKCGVLKLKLNSEFKCKTLHKNSHLGGVLVKGAIKMKIGEKEQELQEGDMAFVPPLTEWQATNMIESESVFYYWCGRFK